MTYLEKFKELYPDRDYENVMICDCPNEYFKGAQNGCSVFENGPVTEVCPKCWDLEYNGEEVI